MTPHSKGAAPAPEGKAAEGLSIIGRFNAWRLRNLIAVNVFAPFFFVLVVGARIYIETELLAPEPYFSYYTLCHHMLWFAGTFLSLMLVIHFIIKTPIKDLFILCYGSILVFIPILYLLLTGQKAALTYLRGGFWEILKHALTFVWTWEADRALSIELGLIFAGITGLAWLITKRPGKAVLTGAVSYSVLMLWAVHWVGKTPHKYAVFSINTWMVSNCLISVVLLHVFSFLVIITIWRAGLFQNAKKAWKAAFITGAAAWIAFSLIMKITQWFVLPFDIAASGLIVFTDAVILTALYKGLKKNISRIALAALIGLFFVQAAVMGPLLIRAEEGLITQGELQNKTKRLEAVLPDA
ncbi:hypothetical protein SAMN02745216_02305 [Desulfatibacillum alkenivorans DSM 16219]|jgi:hypothetical protein|uniref:Uncharacterized protein n=1 Tax=Desulfatibacillum alkenivorans DSM 16219 TaxID=1121393 RepID=A0A1M6MB85_9BACT|nr:hypothetical protein [Desulfatibacillum alkenivorans]SHJ80752.1 hypothetical protein SAMN02745216_02305 [Desulfatibacillum alkenivorans DSM 16219]